MLEAAKLYIKKSRLFVGKLISEKANLPIYDIAALTKSINLEEYIKLLIKHIDLIERRVIKGESIPHEEKMLSICVLVFPFFLV